jgi:hypothetical protein
MRASISNVNASITGIGLSLSCGFKSPKLQELLQKALRYTDTYDVVSSTAHTN